jgi:hypothetical protein
MSSRSFRRRNNRRRHNKPPQGSEAPRAGGRGNGGPDEASGRGVHGNPSQGHRRHPGGRRNAEDRSRDAVRRGGADSVAPRPEPLVFPDCPICAQPVRELPSALTHRETRRPAHFDCIMRELRESNELAPQERICYLGGGSFGILEFRQPGAPSRFLIRKRIQYEEKEAVQDWKKPLLISL